MKLPRFFGKLNRRRPVFVRRVAGESMLPTLTPGQIVFATGWHRRLRPGDIIIVLHQGIEKVKRIQQLTPDHVFVVGDNPADSTDSRDFGWLERRCVIGKLWLAG